jgi:DNA-binding CsgD family transcriptional regulator
MVCVHTSFGVASNAESLRSADLRAVLTFVDDAWAAAGDRPFTRETMEQLAGLIPCDFAGYSELDRVACAVIDDAASGEPAGSEEQFWDIVEELPTCQHELAYLDFSATRLSDVISRRRLVATRAYAEWYRPQGFEAELDAGIVRSRVRTRNFVLLRSHGDSSARDRTVLELIRPHLAHIHDAWRPPQAALAVTPAARDGLTPREEEVLELVATGLTNVGIAERLWISPGTVKKHLENVYAKLGVTNRTAAAAYGQKRRRSGVAPAAGLRRWRGG